MADTNAGTAAPEDQAPETTEPATAPEALGTATPVDEVTTLKSRIAGLDAKIPKLTEAQAAAERRATEAERKLDEFLTGKANEGEETRALLLRLNTELETSKQAAKVAGIAAKYPETYSVIGDGVGTMTEDQLAAAEARFMGVPAESNRPPTPVGNNAARPATGAKTIEAMNLAELKVHMAEQFKDLTWEDITQSD